MYIYNIHIQIHIQYYILPITVQTNITYPEVPCPESWGSCFLFDKVSPKEQKNDAMNPRAWLIEYQTYRPAHADNMRVRALYSLKGTSRVLAITPMPIGTMLGCCCKLSIHLKGSQTHPEIGCFFCCCVLRWMMVDVYHVLVETFGSFLADKTCSTGRTVGQFLLGLAATSRCS